MASLGTNTLPIQHVSSLHVPIKDLLTSDPEDHAETLEPGPSGDPAPRDSILTGKTPIHAADPYAAPLYQNQNYYHPGRNNGCLPAQEDDHGPPSPLSESSLSCSDEEHELLAPDGPSTPISDELQGLLMPTSPTEAPVTTIIEDMIRTASKRTTAVQRLLEASNPALQSEMESITKALEKALIAVMRQRETHGRTTAGSGEALGSSATRPTSSNASEPGDGETKDEGKGAIQEASRLAYKRVEETWDDKACIYSIGEPKKSRLAELNKYLFIVRRRTNRDMESQTTYLDIKSPCIRNALRDVCCDMRGISLADSKPTIELHAIFHVRTELWQYQERISNSSPGGNEARHLYILLGYLDDAFKAIDDTLSSLLAEGKITYDLLWALFVPGAEVYTTCPGTQASRCVLFNQMEERKNMSGEKFLHLETRYLSSDGKALGETTTSSSIPIFRGAKPIEALPAYPLEYHAEKDKVRNQLVECGRKYVSLLGMHHQQYEGLAFDYDKKGNIVAYHVEGPIMVDCVCFQEHMPNYPCARVQTTRPEYSVRGRCDTVKLIDIDPARLQPHELLICSPTVLGFSFEEKRFLEFAVARVRDVQWDECSFNDVQIPDKSRKAIHALTAAYYSRDTHDTFRDVIKGKGRGVNYLLYGPPGTGKTLTAETLAVTFKAPLYTVAAGQIGVDATQVEKCLGNIFKIAGRWKALLLLDEADIFLAQRTMDPHTSALVSVFLRELENFDGILFLTTNRLQTFDEAILSRIHLPIKYQPLSQKAREVVLRRFVEQARTKAGPAVCGDDVISELARKKINGREIRNALFVAQSTADYDGTVVTEKHLRDSFEIRKQLDQDFQGAGAIENVHSYF